MVAQPKERRPIVFISYAHESDALRSQVQDLGHWLQQQGCEVLTDEMHGNVWEWCADGMHKYTSAAVTNPVGAVESDRALRALRGGFVDRCRPAHAFRVSLRRCDGFGS